MNKNFGMAIALIVASTAAAAAADLKTSQPMKKPISMVAASSWTGCYIGGNVGAAMSKTDVTDEVDGSFIASLDSSAVAGGGQIGCDYQLSSNSPWVIGVQGMYDATKLSSSTTPSSGPLYPATLAGEIPWVMTLTARAGYLVNSDLLVYGKLGGAWAHTNSNISYEGTTLGTASFTQNGWTLGAGAELKVAPNVSLFAEYDYLGLNDKVVTFAPTPDKGNVDQNVQLLLVGANFRISGM
jgi:outer membrane immunogenic protein